LQAAWACSDMSVDEKIAVPARRALRAENKIEL
jgi:hypothetical protein